MFNLMGPKHTGMFALLAAVGMVLITLLISAFALPKVPWHDLPSPIGHLNHQPDAGLGRGRMGETGAAFPSVRRTDIDDGAGRSGLEVSPCELHTRRRRCR